MSGLPPNRPVLANDTDIEWIPNPAPGQAPDPRYPMQNVDYWQYVTRDFAETLGVPIVKGRSFSSSDIGGAPVAVVNEALVKKFFYDRNPIGERLKPGFAPTMPWFTIIGVYKDIRQGGVDVPAGTELFLLEDQLPTITPIQTNMNFVLRTAQSASALAGPIRQAIAAELSTRRCRSSKLQSMDTVFQGGRGAARVSHHAPRPLCRAGPRPGGGRDLRDPLVSGERAEWQDDRIRTTLGTDQGQILRHFLLWGLLLAGTGVALGLVAAMFLTKLIRTLLFNVSPTDPATLVLVSVTMAGVAALACLIPAWRATRVEPIIVLRGV